jgi:Uma2 family endonuclease
MASPVTRIANKHVDLLPIPGNLEDIPILYEDEDEGDMGESNPHVVTDGILHICIQAHLAGRPKYRVFSNMNLYYRDGPRHPRTGSLPYVSPDIMVVVPYRPLGERITSYTIGTDGPAPRSVTETLSERSAQQRDLKEKTVAYSKLGVGEYILVDPTGAFLPERLLLKRLQRNGEYKDEQDADGGVTSDLGFRLIFDEDGLIRVLDAATGKPYIRPAEAEKKIQDLEARSAQKIGQLENELQRLRRLLDKQQKPRKRKKGK